VYQTVGATRLTRRSRAVGVEKKVSSLSRLRWRLPKEKPIRLSLFSMFQSCAFILGSITTHFGLPVVVSVTHSLAARPSVCTVAVSWSLATMTSTGIIPGDLRSTSTRVT